jgi:Ku70/Ku80 beta-barrel domain
MYASIDLPVRDEASSSVRHFASAINTTKSASFPQSRISAPKVLALPPDTFLERFMAHSFRPSWSGSIRLSLVSVPVKGYTALEAEKARISLNQLHDDCHSRIKYKKTCPVHGEVPIDEIVMGYQYDKDKYAIIDTDEINKLRSEADRAVTIERFVPPDTIDPMY